MVQNLKQFVGDLKNKSIKTISSGQLDNFARKYLNATEDLLKADGANYRQIISNALFDNKLVGTFQPWAQSPNQTLLIL